MKGYNLVVFFITLTFFSSCWGMESTVFDVGQGNCVLFGKPGAKEDETVIPLLCDCGSSAYKYRGLDYKKDQTRAIANKIIKYLEDVKKKRFIILISHPDIDHYGWVDDVIEKCKECEVFVDSVILGGMEKQYSSGFSSVLSALKKQEHAPNIIYLTESESTEKKSTLFSSGSVTYEILPALKGSKKIDSNDTSLVLQVTCGKLSCMVMGDATKKTTDHIQKYIKLFSADLLIASHHGAEDSGCNSESWIQKVAPSMVVLSAGIHGHKHPRALTVKRFSECLGNNLEGYCPLVVGSNDKGSVPNNVQFSNGYTLGMTSKPLFGTLTHGTMTFSWSENDIELSLPKYTIGSQFETLKGGVLSTLTSLSNFGLSPQIIIVIDISGLQLDDRLENDKDQLCRLLTLLKESAESLKKLCLSSNTIQSHECYELLLGLLERDSIRDFQMKDTGMSEGMKQEITKVWNNRGLML